MGVATVIHYKNGCRQTFYCSPDNAVALAGGSSMVKGYQIGFAEQRVKSYCVEASRTNAGCNMASWQEASRRVRVKIENAEIDGVNAWGDVFTSTDGGKWVAEGRYVLSVSVETIEPEFIEVA